MTRRKGSQLEAWASENIKGIATKNSGATFRDADMKVGGVGGRLYEFKSSEVNRGLALQRDHLLVLLQRSLKLNRDPIFIVQNASRDRYAVMPLTVLMKMINRWNEVAPGFNQEVERVARSLEQSIIVKSKGNNIRLKEDKLKFLFDRSETIIYRTKNGIHWVIMDVELWLDLSRDRKSEVS